ncbi:uncharacterized protein PHACADRAFT_202357 [Phanerochaete carnosa HHB-10118-sp]|uniref:AB hydrolase-1 domain-containing protein n=1 Tax=Phanerochaete carnosa (strain HHB-10118-sp) TaxID=650164 RepID=K5VQ28_PHACS|nr:uncharacterized protein PHACADRAFT_201733 [Phanerochaete carnosa HHB-10118-sp]XP_007402631.1 uncharacterized protein PHACADRAFT_202357 [Phanerochaete carnosa HHB-10118-sp]EKM48815.1 hypothetical protein PHACADRAFT_202357 [Phanerochaete carnosa HHB-10118-sp]EKM49471.1 hypothetical protein PHACADRAFT_201733 [Phanerochaete carnosa HHB-10118-sp]
MLGIGETEKPINPAAYVLSLKSREIADVLDAAKLGKVDAIGHGWGCKAISHLTSYHPGRIFAYVFLSISFVQVLAPMNFQEFLGSLKQQLGCTWWTRAHLVPQLLTRFADRLVRQRQFLYDSEIWKERLMSTGVLEQSLLESFVLLRPSYLSEEDAVGTFRRRGFAVPTRWCEGFAAEILPERMSLPARAAIHFAAAEDDCVCLSKTGYAPFGQEVFSGHGVAMETYDANH